jgi:mycofactocin radical SAM maturase
LKNHTDSAVSGRLKTGHQDGAGCWAPLGAPVTVTWEITPRCNLSCRHCLSGGGDWNSGAELDFDRCRRFIDQLGRMEVFQINFGGGEPFLREDFVDILDYAHSKGITTCVSTNGTVHDARLAGKLARMKLLRIQVSLDGATAAVNDAIRGAGTFERILTGLELFVKHGVPHLSVNTVVTRANFHEIGLLCALARRYGIQSRLSRFRPSGKARAAWRDLHLDRDQVLGLADFLNAHPEVLTGDSFFSIADERRRRLGLNACGAARMTCCILPDGSVYPCAFLQDEPFLGGNILRETLEEIWLHAPSFTRLRSIRVDACAGCSRFSLCHGGCPAVANFLEKSPDRPDPECIASFKDGVSDHVQTV